MADKTAANGGSSQAWCGGGGDSPAVAATVRRWLFAFALVGALSRPGIAQTPGELAADYVREGQAIALGYFTRGEATDGDAWRAFITDSEAWVGDQLGDGALDFFRKAGLYGAGRLTLEAPVTAGQAARINGRLQMTELNGCEWPVRIDVIQVEGAWRLRAVRLTARRPLPGDADPLALVNGYLDHIDTGLTRLETTAEELPLHQALGQELAYGAGFWTSEAQGSAIGLYGHLSSVELETASAELLSSVGDGASVRLHTERTRRTFVQANEWRMDLTRHASRGWEISGMQRIDVDAPPDIDAPRVTDAAAAPAGGFDSPVALVEHVLELAAGSSDLIAFATAAEPYFAATSDGRRSAAQLGSMRQLSADVTPRWTVSAARAGGVRAELIEGGQMVRMMMPVLIFETVNEGGLLIASVAVER